MQTAAPYHVLFLCTGNSARSILGEVLLRALGGGRFATWSAGSQPRGVVNPLALLVLERDYGLDASGARSKSWSELADIPFDLVLTLCDDARESCPLWPRRTLIAHWGMPDPAAVEGSDEEKLAAFRDAASVLHRRLSRLSALPLDELAPEARRAAVEALATA